MAEEAVRGIVPRLRLVRYPKDATILSAQGGRGHAPAHRLRRPRRQPAQHSAGRTRPHARPRGALSRRGALRRRRDHARLPRARRTRPATCSRARTSSTLRHASPEFERYCTQAITETLRQSLESLYGQYSQRAAEQQTLTRTLGELVRNAPVACPATATARARRRSGWPMRKRAHDRRARRRAARRSGMFTLVDLLRRVVLPGRPLEHPAGRGDDDADRHAAGVRHRLRGDARDGRARHAPGRRRRERAAAAGVVNERDLFALQRVSMRQVTEGLHGADTIDKLKRAAEDIRRLTQNLLAQGVGAEPLTRTIAVAQRCAVAPRDRPRGRAARSRRHRLVLARARQRGSRRADVRHRPGQRAAVRRRRTRRRCGALRERLLAFRARGQRRAGRAGLPALPGQRDGQQSRAVPVGGRVEGQVPRLDPRADAAGAAQRQHHVRLPAALRRCRRSPTRCAQWLFGYTQANPAFLRLMVQNALSVEPPRRPDPHVRRRRRRRTSKGTLDLKARGTRLFVDCARVFALALGHRRHRHRDAAAPRRRARCTSRPRHVEATVEAFHFLQMLRLRQQDVAAGTGHANRIDPYALNEVEPAHAEGGVPPGEAAAGPAAAGVPAVARGAG